MQLSKQQLQCIQRLCRKFDVLPTFFLHRFRLILHQFHRYFGRRHFLVNSMQPLKHDFRGKSTIIWSRFRRTGLVIPPKKQPPNAQTKLRVTMRRKGHPKFVLMKKDRNKWSVVPTPKAGPIEAAKASNQPNHIVPKPNDLGPDKTASDVNVSVATNIIDIALGSPLHEFIESNPDVTKVCAGIVNPKSSSDQVNTEMQSVSESSNDKPLEESLECETNPICELDKSNPPIETSQTPIIDRRSSTPVQDELDMHDTETQHNDVCSDLITNSGANVKTNTYVNLKERSLNYKHIFDLPAKPKDSTMSTAEPTDSDIDASLVIDESFNSEVSFNNTAIEPGVDISSIDDPHTTPEETSDGQMVVENQKDPLCTSDRSETDLIDQSVLDVNAPSDNNLSSTECNMPTSPQLIEHIVKNHEETNCVATPENISDTHSAADMCKSVPTESELNNQLREQLSFFKMGKRKESFLGEPIGGAIRVKSGSFSRNSTPSLSRNVSNASIEDHHLLISPAKLNQTDKTQVEQPRHKHNFIDSLINRIQQNSGTEPIEPTIKPRDVKTHKPISNKGSDEDSSDSPEFFGFNAHDTENRPLLAVPGLMATPVVPKSNVAKSAFVSEALDTFMKENALENSSHVEIPIARIQDDALITSDAQPPSLTCPELPEHLKKPRTLADKREQLEGQTDVKILMIENETSVFRELKKRSRAGATSNYRYVRSIQEHNIPFTRDCWRATSWLATKTGRFYYQTIRTSDGNHLKMIGGTGNHRQKCIYEFPKCTKLAPAKKNSQVALKSHSLPGVKIKNIAEYMEMISPSTAKTLVDPVKKEEPTRAHMPINFNKLSTQRRMTCGPLSKKQLCDQRTSMDMDLGPLQIYNMPTIHLEVWPKLETPLPEQIRPYLKMAMPFDCLTPKWIDFALTALKVPIKESYTTLSGRSISKATYNEEKLCGPPKPVAIKRQNNVSFVFDIPYTNDQRRLLIRSRRKMVSAPCKDVSTSAIEKLSNGDDCLLFDRDIDRKDAISVDVAQMMRAIFDSVEISINEPNMWKEDPDSQIKDKDPIVSMEKTDSCEPGLTIRKSSDNSQRIRKELKRLNATIIDNYEAPAKVNCTEDFCKMGCVCNSLSKSRICPTHCKRFECMLKCSCQHKPNHSTATRNSNIEQLRSRATADLAKEEKEFRATVVLSQDRTIYIPNHENVGKRSKRVPKRFHDSLDSPFAPETPLSTPVVSRKSLGTEIVAQTVERTPLQRELHKIANCTVSLLQMPPLGKLEPWCMVHCLYKCFCKQKAMTGQPFTFNDTGKIRNSEPEEFYSPPKKRQYTFEKVAPAETVVSTDVCERESQASRTIAFIGRMRSRKEIKKMHEMYRKIEEDNPSLRKLLNNRKRRCWMHDEKVYTVDSDAAVGPEQPPDQPKKSTIRKKKRKTNLQETTRIPQAGESLLRLAQPRAAEKPKATRQTESGRHERISHEINSQEILVNKDTSRIPNCDRLVEEPAKKSLNSKHEHNTKYFNYCVNRTMEQIKNAQIETTMVKKPVPKSLNCIQWNRFVALFLANRIFIWEIRLESEEVQLGVTVEQVMPLVPGAISAINIKSVPTERLPLVARLCKHAVFGPKTAQAALLICGISNYWKIISIIHSDKNYMEEDHRVQPSPSTHPELAAKIAKLFQMLTRNVNAKTNTEQSKDAKITTRKESELPVSLKQKFNLPKSHINMTPDRIVQSNMSFSSQPGEHKWLVLAVANDFSHIFIPSWNSFVLKDKIVNAMKLCMKFNKTVKISAPNIIPDLFATANEPGKLFFGPYPKDAVLDIGLYHLFNKQFMSAEEYFKKVTSKTNLNGHRVRTTGCWLYVKHIPTETVVSEPQPSLGTTAKVLSDKESDDEDCMIVETPNEVIDLFEDSDDSDSNEPSSSSRQPLSAPIDASLEEHTTYDVTPSPSTSTTPPALLRITDHSKQTENISLLNSSQECSKNKPVRISIMSSMKTSKSPNKPMPVNSGRLPTPGYLDMCESNGDSKPKLDKPQTFDPEPISGGSFVDILNMPPTSTNLNIVRLPPTPVLQQVAVAPTKNLAPGSFIKINKALIRTLPKNLIITKIGKRNSIDGEPAEPPPSAKQVCLADSRTEQSQQHVFNRDIINLESDEDETIVPDFDSSNTNAQNMSIPSTPAILSTLKGTQGEVAYGNGYLVSNLGQILGKIRVEVNRGKMSMLLYNVMQPEMSFDAVGKFLHEQIREQVYAFEPRNLQIHWNFVPESSKHTIASYSDWSQPLFSPTTVLTETHSIDLLSDFETSEVALPRELLLRLLVLKLAYLCQWSRQEVRTKSFSEILQKGEEYVKTQIRRESKFEKLKVSWAVKIHLNQAKLSKLKNQLSNDVNAVSTTVSTAISSAGTHPRLIVSLEKKPSEVIEIDDDDE